MDLHQFSSAVGWIPLILARIKSPYLEEVEFSIFLSQIDQIDPTDFPIDWESYDKLFAWGVGFQRLQRLTFAVYVPGVEEEVVEKEMRKRLPDCDTRGILCVHSLRNVGGINEAPRPLSLMH